MRSSWLMGVAMLAGMTMTVAGTARPAPRCRKAALVVTSDLIARTARTKGLPGPSVPARARNGRGGLRVEAEPGGSACRTSS